VEQNCCSFSKERHFLEFSFCLEGRADLQDAMAQGKLPGYDVRASPSECSASASALLDDPKLDSLRRKAAMAPHLRSMRALFSDRLAVVHQDHLKADPRHIFSALVAFLGASFHFPITAEFGRYNAWGGHRTELCRNASLVAALREALEPEYRAQARLCLFYTERDREKESTKVTERKTKEQQNKQAQDNRDTLSVHINGRML
jgi:hypothetical protein